MPAPASLCPALEFNFLTMKPPQLALAAVIIAIASGSGGYFIGKNKGPESESSHPDRHVSPQAKTGTRSATPSRTDYSTLRRELDAQNDPLARFKLAIQNLEGWIDADPEAAMGWLQSQPRTARLQDIMRKALARYAANNPKGAATWAAENLTGHELNNSLILIAEEWAERDGLEAATWISNMPPTRERDAAMESMFFAWASNDPAAAIDFIGKNASSPQLAAMLRHAAYAGWAKSDPVGAVSASLETSKTHNDPAQFANTIANWAIMDLAAGSQWLIDNVSSGEQRSIAVQELASIFASQSPESGLQWISKLKPGQEQTDAYKRLATDWGSSDPAGAAKWVGTQNHTSLDPDTISHILHNYLASDSNAYEAWHASLPEGPLKQQANEVMSTADGAEAPQSTPSPEPR